MDNDQPMTPPASAAADPTLPEGPMLLALPRIRFQQTLDAFWTLFHGENNGVFFIGMAEALEGQAGIPPELLQAAREWAIIRCARRNDPYGPDFGRQQFWEGDTCLDCGIARDVHPVSPDDVLAYLRAHRDEERAAAERDVDEATYTGNAVTESCFLGDHEACREQDGTYTSVNGHLRSCDCGCHDPNSGYGEDDESDDEE